MDRLHAMRAFVAVADQGGFAAAGRHLSLSPPAVTRAVAALEERTGTLLFHRTTRVVRLTEAGTRFVEDCKRILAAVEDAEASAAGSHAEPRGQLAVTAPVLFGRMFVAPLLLQFLARYPLLTARALLLDRVVDLVEEGLDVAVRIAHLPDSSLSAIRIGSVRRVLCASPRYLAAHGVPRQPSDLAAFDAIAFSSARSRPEWSFGTGSRTETVRPVTKLIVNTAELSVAAAVAGRGVTRVLSYQIGPELRRQRLAIVLQEFEPPPIPIHVVHTEGRRASARVRAFVDWTVERLRAEPSLR
jgi:DNA-binding transcriptional LysR family regulator